MDSLTEDIDQASTPKKKRLRRMNSQEGMTALIKSDNREGRVKKVISVTSKCTERCCCFFNKALDLASVCPSTRWSHTMCLSDPDTAVLIGGEAADQNYCKDSLWKLELGQSRLLNDLFNHLLVVFFLSP